MHSGVSTWTKPTELEGIEFTDPVPDIKTAKQNVKVNFIKSREQGRYLASSWQAAHQASRDKENQILAGFPPGGEKVRGERDKQPPSHHQHHQQHSGPAPLTNHNTLSMGRPVTSQLNLPQTKDKGK